MRLLTIIYYLLIILRISRLAKITLCPATKYKRSTITTRRLVQQ